MEQYLLMAVELKHLNSICVLGDYYYYIEQDYVSMKKYYEKAIDLNDIISMYKLAKYYKFVENNNILMEKYILMILKFEDVNKKIELENNIYYNHVIYYKMLSSFENKNELIINKINELENFLSVKIHKINQIIYKFFY